MKWHLVWSTLFLVVLSACGKSGSVSPELLRINNSKTSLSYGELLQPETRGISRAGVGVNSNLTITSLKVPIRTVSLNTSADGGGGAIIYECEAGTNDGCLVDLTSANALENLLTGASTKSIAVGTYTHVQISTCQDEGKYTAKIQASGKVQPDGSGSTYYTQAGSGALTTTASEVGEATVHFTGCSRTYPLPTAVTVAENSTVKVKLYFDIRDIAFFGDVALGGGEAYYAGGYSYEYPAAPPGTYVGVNYLDVAGTVDEGTPTTARFRVKTAAGELGTIGLMYTSGGAYFGGYTRSFFSTDSAQGHNRFVTPLQIYSDNGDGSFTIENYGSSATGSGYFRATTFVKATDNTPRPFSAVDGTNSTYTIEALP